jgi:hypothetical protein
VPPPVEDGFCSTGREADEAEAELTTVTVDSESATRSRISTWTLCPGASRASAPNVTETVESVTCWVQGPRSAPCTSIAGPLVAEPSTSEPSSGSRSVTTRPVRSAVLAAVLVTVIR